MSPDSLSPFATTVVLGSIALIPLAMVGLALLNTGLGRSRSAAHSMMASLCVLGVAALAYFVCGFSWEGFAGRPAHVLLAAGKPWDWIAREPFFFRHLEFDGCPASLAACFQLFAVGLAALIPLGAGGDRWRLGASCGSTALFAGLVYPLFAHWVWGGGWLAQLGQNFGLGHGFVDAGGSSSIQAVGGLAALGIAWILGPRRGKYSSTGILTAIPGHNAVFVLLGSMLALVGWIGLNSAGAVLFAGVAPGGVTLVVVNTTLAAASAGLTAAAVTRIRFGKPDASISANGWVGGLAASSAACAFVKPAAAVLIGIVAGGLVTLAIDWFEFYLKLDDPGGSISVHGLGGLWGVTAVGLFARFPEPGQFLAQFVGVATLIGFVLPLAYGLNWGLDRLFAQRVSPDGERQGMDLHELGADAYPDFVTHSEEFMQR